MFNFASSSEYVSKQIADKLDGIWRTVYPMFAMQRKFDTIVDSIVAACNSPTQRPRSVQRDFGSLFSIMYEARYPLHIYMEVLARINELSRIPRLDAIVQIKSRDQAIAELKLGFDRVRELGKLQNTDGSVEGEFKRLFEQAKTDRSLRTIAGNYLRDAKERIRQLSLRAGFSGKLTFEQLREPYRNSDELRDRTTAHAIVARYARAAQVLITTLVYFCRDKDYDFHTTTANIFTRAETFSNVSLVNRLSDQFFLVYITEDNDENITRRDFLERMNIEKFGVYKEYVRWLVENMSMSLNDIVAALRNLSEFISSELTYISMLVVAVFAWLEAFFEYGSDYDLRDIMDYLAAIKNARQVKHLFAFLRSTTEISELPERIPENVAIMITRTTDPQLRVALSQMFVDVQLGFDRNDIEHLLAAVHMDFRLYPYDEGQLKLACRRSDDREREQVQQAVVESIDTERINTRNELHSHFNDLCSGLAVSKTNNVHYITAVFVREYLNIVSTMEVVISVAGDPKLYQEAQQVVENESLARNERDGIVVFEKMYVEYVKRALEDFQKNRAFEVPPSDPPIQVLIDGNTLYKFGVHRYLVFPILSTMRVCTELPEDAKPLPEKKRRKPVISLGKPETVSTAASSSSSSHD